MQLRRGVLVAIYQIVKSQMRMRLLKAALGTDAPRIWIPNGHLMTHFLTIRVMKRICVFSFPTSWKGVRSVSRMRADDPEYTLCVMADLLHLQM